MVKGLLGPCSHPKIKELEIVGIRNHRYCEICGEACLVQPPPIKNPLVEYCKRDVDMTFKSAYTNGWYGDE